MTDYSDIERQLRKRLDELLQRAQVIEDDLRHPLDKDWEEQAVDLADDDALEGVDEVLREEIQQIRLALLRIRNGTYGTCAVCGGPIGRKRLEALPMATRCIDCASKG